MAIFIFCFFLVLCITAVSSGQNSISCFDCHSTSSSVSRQCLTSVAETRKYHKNCAPGVTRCYAKFTPLSDELIRGCANNYDKSFRDCILKSSPFCSICTGDLCNNWNALEESDLHCSFCSNRQGDISCNELRDTQGKCPIVATHGTNIYCFTAFDLSSGRITERGCIEDRVLADTHGHFLLPCEGNNCNEDEDLQKFSCASFNGFVSKFDHQKQTVRCDARQKSQLPGCYTVLGGKIAQMGCNSQLTVQEFATLTRPNSSAQFCYTPDCNRPAVNQCQYLSKYNSEVATEICEESSTRCFIRRDPFAPNKFASGCVPKSLFPFSDPDVHFCSNGGALEGSKPCNDNETYSLNTIACHQCAGILCRDALGNHFKRTCPEGTKSCFTAEGFDGVIERGCVTKKAVSGLCKEFPDWCHQCTENYCNDATAQRHYRSCRERDNVQPCTEDEEEEWGNFEGIGYEDEPEEEMMLLSGARQKMESSGVKEGPKAYSLPMIEEFSCFQCHSLDFFDKTCDEDVRYLRPTPCAHLYGSRPSSCYTLIHRGWMSLERGCGSELDQYTYKTCDTDLFAECKLCAESGCNNEDMTEVLRLKANKTSTTTAEPVQSKTRGPTSGPTKK